MNKQNTDIDAKPQVIGFVCNWGAYSGVEMAGIDKREYPASVRLLRLTCLGRLHLGHILKSFELGADGVMLLGCPQRDCYYECGMTRARELYAEARNVLHLLGIDTRRLAIVELPVGRGDILTKQVSTFIKRISRGESSPLRFKAGIASLA